WWGRRWSRGRLREPRPPGRSPDGPPPAGEGGRRPRAGLGATSARGGATGPRARAPRQRRTERVAGSRAAPPAPPALPGGGRAVQPVEAERPGEVLGPGPSTALELRGQHRPETRVQRQLVRDDELHAVQPSIQKI